MPTTSPNKQTNLHQPDLSCTHYSTTLGRTPSISNLAIAMAAEKPSRPLLRRMFSFREPLAGCLFLIPLLLGFLSASVKSFFLEYLSLAHSFAKLLSLSSKSTYAPLELSDVGEEEEEEGDGAEEVDQTLAREEVGEILERIGLSLNKEGETLEASMGHEEVSCVFEAEEPSFEEVKQAFAVFDHNNDGFIDATDLQRALAKLGLQEDLRSCRWMIAAAATNCQSKDHGRMNLFQFVKFLESGFC